MQYKILLFSALLAFALFCPTVCRAGPGTERVINGGFETADLTGWHIANQSGSTGTFQIGDATFTNEFGPVSPVEQYNDAGSSAGRYYAVTDSLFPGTDGPSTMVMYQEINLGTFATFSSAVLHFDLQVQDYSGLGPLNGSLTTPLDYTQPDPTQFMRVDLMDADALAGDAFTVAPSSVLQTLYLGGTDTNSPTYDTFDFDITGLVNQQKQAGKGEVSLRFAIVSGAGFYHANVDNVSLLADGAIAAPESSSFAYVLSGLAFLVLYHLYNHAHRKTKPTT